jgi:hypothetical protein
MDAGLAAEKQAATGINPLLQAFAGNCIATTRRLQSLILAIRAGKLRPSSKTQATQATAPQKTRCGLEQWQESKGGSKEKARYMCRAVPSTKSA